MKIAKPLLLITTPLGVAEGLYEGYKWAGGLVVIMIAMVGVMLVALATVIATIRREAAAQRTGKRDIRGGESDASGE